VVLVVEGERLPAHRNVLAARSEGFGFGGCCGGCRRGEAGRGAGGGGREIELGEAGAIPALFPRPWGAAGAWNTTVDGPRNIVRQYTRSEAEGSSFCTHQTYYVHLTLYPSHILFCISVDHHDLILHHDNALSRVSCCSRE